MNHMKTTATKIAWRAAIRLFNSPLHFRRNCCKGRFSRWRFQFQMGMKEISLKVEFSKASKVQFQKPSGKANEPVTVPWLIPELNDLKLMLAVFYCSVIREMSDPCMFLRKSGCFHALVYAQKFIPLSVWRKHHFWNCVLNVWVHHFWKSVQDLFNWKGDKIQKRIPDMCHPNPMTIILIFLTRGNCFRQAELSNMLHLKLKWEM